MVANADLDAGGESFRKQAWAEALAQLPSVGRESALGPDASWLVPELDERGLDVAGQLA